MQLKRTTARDYIADRPELILQPDRNGGFICPICGSGSGKHGTGLFIERDKRHYTCFAGSCFKNKSIFDIIGLQYGLTDFKDIMNKAAELAGIDLLPDGSRAPEDFAGACRCSTDAGKTSEPEPRELKDYYANRFFDVTHKDIDNTDYWKRRGFTRETMSRFKIGFVRDFTFDYARKDRPEFKGDALIIPVTRYAFTARNVDPEAPHNKRYRKKGDYKAFYNPLKIDFANLDRAVFIVEGELDALSIIQAGGAAVAIRSANNTADFIEWLKERQPLEPRGLFGFMDGDDAGRLATAQITEGLKGTNFLFEGFSPGKSGDANRILQEAPEELAKFLDRFNKNYDRYTEILKNGLQ